MADKIQFQSMVFFAFIIPLLAFFIPLAIAPVFIIIAIYPAYLLFKSGFFKTIWSDSDVNKIVIILLAYSLISSLWAINPRESLNLWVRILLFFIGALGLFNYVLKMQHKEKILTALLAGIVVALAFANIEILTNGFISKFFHISYKVSHKFELVIFNRGASILSIMSWAVICYLCNNKKYKTACLIFLVVLITIIRLDSLSTVLGFLIAGIFVFPIVYYQGQKALTIFAILTIVGVFTFAAAASMINANKLVGNIPVIAGAASDIRIYIWDYAAKQSLKKPILGWGFNASRSYPVQPSDYVQNGRSPLPLHPHNNTLQIWLELGLVGVVLFAAFLFLVLTRIAKTVAEPYMAGICTALFANYFIIGQTGYGVWQNWWVAGGILAITFLKMAINTTPSRSYKV